MTTGEKPTKEDFTNWQNDSKNWKWAFSISTKMTKEFFRPKGINMQDGL